MRIFYLGLTVILTSCNVFLDLDKFECSDLDDCDRGWQCVAGECVVRDTCTADDQCDNGLRCEAGFCFVVCETDVQCRDSRVCRSGDCELR